MPDPNVTLMLENARSGDPEAAERLLPLVYDELRRLAASRLRRAPVGHTLQPTALVHEAFIKLVGNEDPGWSGRAHFFAAAAQAMREILRDHARSHATLKRGGDRKRVDADPDQFSAFDRSDRVLALENALTKLEAEDERKARIVTLRHYGGLTNEQIADLLDVSKRTIEREWQFARAWLHRELGDGGGPRRAREHTQAEQAGETAGDG